MSKQKRRDPLKGLIAWTIVLVLLAAGAIVGSRMLADYRQGILLGMQQEVRDRNLEKQNAYNQEVADFNRKLASNEANEAWPEAAPEGWDVIDLTNFPLEVPGTVNVSRADVMNNGLLLVNEWHSRPDDFDESGIVAVYTYAREAGLPNFWSGSSNKLFPVAVDALIEALKGAKEAGFGHYVIDDSYRTWDRQNELFQEQMEYYRERYPDFSEEKLKERAMTKINYPGTSEFNSGLSFTLYLYESGNETYKDKGFYELPEGLWFYENSWKYGLVFRFPKENYPTAETTDKTYKTGMSQKLNCYRYVGTGNAAVMHHLDLCLEEYIEYLMEHPHIAVFENGMKKYEITRQQVGDANTFTVDVNRISNDYTMYLDNMGGLITVYAY